MILRKMFAGLILSLVTSAAFAQERFLRPVDEGVKDASFVAFRNKLITATKAKDAAVIRSILDPRITNDFGGVSGRSDFLKLWNNLEPKSDFWHQFLAVITGGGRFSREPGGPSKFWAPYTFIAFPEDLDAFTHAAIFGKDVNLRKSPRSDAEIITRLSYNLVKVDQDNWVHNGDDTGTLVWAKVETFGGKSGYVKAEYVRSPVDYRASFEKKRGVWKMTALIEGD